MLDSFSSQHETRETSDTYTRVITILRRHRVIVGACNHQWIVQRAVGKGAARRWVGRDFCRTRKALLRVWHRLHRDEACERWPELERLPEHFNRWVS